MISLNIETIRSLDKSDMLNLLVGFPKQLLDALKIGNEIEFAKDIKKGFSNIVFTGLGGSAIGADLIRSYISRECKLPVTVNRDYTLPGFVGKETLLVVSSYSGNTEETISAYNEGREKGARIIAITSNGQLKKMSKEDGFPCVTIPQGLPPRCALGYSSIPTLVLFCKLGLISDKASEVKESADIMSGLYEEALSAQVAQEKNVAKSIASALFEKYAVIYGANQRTDCVATRWRGQLAENSKTISSTHLFPEMNHNEIVGWQNPKNLLKDLTVILLRDQDDHPRIKTRMDISKSIIKKEGARIVEVTSRGKSLLARIFSLVYIGDFVSFYLAILNNIDPTPVDSITYLKKELAKI